MTQSTYPARRRAAVLSDFGEADNLSVREVPTPALRSDEMLVRVKATSVNPIEWKMRRGLGLPKALWRLLIGRPMILGIDFSGAGVACCARVFADAFPARAGMIGHAALLMLDTSSDRTPLARMLLRVIGSPAGERGRVPMPVRIPWPLWEKAAVVADMFWRL
jgi:hypothetical protein